VKGIKPIEKPNNTTRYEIGNKSPRDLVFELFPTFFFKLKNVKVFQKRRSSQWHHWSASN